MFLDIFSILDVILLYFRCFPVENASDVINRIYSDNMHSLMEYFHMIPNIDATVVQLFTNARSLSTQ